MLSTVFPDSDEALSRTLNHRHYIDAEIRSMIKSFDNDDETGSNKLSNVLLENEHMLSVKMNFMKNSDNLNRMQQCELKLTKIDELIQGTLKMETVQQQSRQSILNDYRDKVSNDYLHFSNHIEEQKKLACSSFEHSKANIYEKYKSQLEE